MSKDKDANPMRKIKIDKLVINCCVGGEGGETVNKAAKVLSDLSGSDKKPVISKCKYTIRSWGVRRGDKIAAHITLRGDRARDILDRGLRVKEYELPRGAFSNTGCFGFGIKEHIDLGLRYDPYTGIFGMDFYVVLKRTGDRIAKRKIKQSRVGARQKISKEESQEWFKANFDGIVI